MRVVLIAIVAAVAATLGGDVTAAGGKAAVYLSDPAPLTVVGLRFEPRERVTVRVLVANRSPVAKVVTATAAGRFVASFPGRALPECAAVRVIAVGTGGSRATWWEPPPPCGIYPG